jgi:hypothetical protein
LELTEKIVTARKIGFVFAIIFNTRHHGKVNGDKTVLEAKKYCISGQSRCHLQGNMVATLTEFSRQESTWELGADNAYPENVVVEGLTHLLTCEFCLLTPDLLIFLFFICRKRLSVFIFLNSVHCRAVMGLAKRRARIRRTKSMNTPIANRSTRGWLFSAFVGLLMLGFSPAAADDSQPSEEQAQPIKTILILPFQVATEHHQIGATVRCYECNYFVQTGPIEPGAGDYMNAKLFNYLNDKTPFTAIAYWKQEWVTAENLSQDFRGTERRLLVQIGRSVKADAVMIGTIYRFRQRVGAALGVDSPASVAFALELIRVADGRIIWHQPFDETQQSLDENLLNIGKFFNRGGKWVTAEELATEGLAKMMKTLPKP